MAESSDDLAARTDHRETVEAVSAQPRPSSPPAPLPPAHVVEPEQPTRIRRPNDLWRLIGWATFTGLLLVVGDVALGTTAGLEEDLQTAITTLPDLILTVLAFASNFLLLLIPPLVLADLAIRRRWRTIWVAAAAGVAGWLLSYAFSVLGQEYLSATLLDALTTGNARGSRSAIVFPLLTAIVALVSVDGLRGRPRLSFTVWGTVIGFTVLVLFDQSATPLALAVSAAGGRAVGLAFRYGVGTVNPRPTGVEVAEALARVAVPLSYLKWDGESDDERHYVGSTLDGQLLDIRVIDRDRRSAGLAYQLYRRMRVQGVVERPPTWSVRRAVDQSALPVLAARRHNVRTPDLVAAASITSESAVLAFEDSSRMRTFRDIDVTALDDQTIAELWKQVRMLHRAGIAHEELHAGNLALDDDGRVWLLGLEYGEIAADQLTLRIDDAELLVTMALLVGADRAVRGALQELTAQRLGQALPLLQPIALSQTNRAAIKRNGDVLQQLRDAVVAAFPAAPTEPVRLERMRPRTFLAFFAFTFAAYVLLGQLASVNLVSIVTEADPIWVAVALVASTVTYIAAGIVITSLAPVALRWWRTFLTQLAATFVSLIAPAAVGQIGTNSRYLQQAGARPALAVASVGASQLFVFASYAILVVLFGFITGRQEGPDLLPDTTVLLVVAGTVAVAAALLAIPATRRQISSRLGPTLSTTWPRLLETVRQPRRVAMGIGGAVLLNLAYAAALFAAVAAYGGNLAFATVGFVYLAAGAVGSAAPTPGGIGAVEAALAFGLTAAGLDSSTAVQAALLFRATTFWLPMAPGWVSFTYLQRVGAL
ncbi:MAG TPA: lysylphosphatidylglycerol synthase transmembrane domain-containing protein [Actinomycetes bacterium]|nr:lysylphosphatidylglycerol synthase transmembrane domain-containing protein [Actinomycetes bacterium]